MTRSQPKVIFYGANWCIDSQRVKKWFGEHDVTYDWKNIDDDKILEEMKKKAGGQGVTPTLDIDGEILVNPSNEELEKVFGNDDTKEKYHEAVMIGAGPTALAAAIYTTREDIDTLLIEKGVVGGLAAITDKVENYPGFPEGVGGLELSENLRQQAERFGSKIKLGEVSEIKDEGKYKRIVTTEEEILAKTVLIATGSDYKRLGIPGEKEFYGRGVHYCATCDGALYRDKRLIVVGGGNSAAQESLFLTKFASHIDILIRGDKWKASEVMVKKIEQNDKITVHFNTRPQEIIGEGNFVKKVKALNTKEDKEADFEADGVFVFIGLVPNTGFLKETSIELDEFGFIKTDKSLETNIPGVFAAGDVRSGATMQIASAVGEGATAALMIRQYLEDE